MILRPEEIAQGTGGRLLRTGPAGPIGTDSRRLRPGDWFLALEGENHDAHAFLPLALAAGCAGAVARRVPEGWTAGFVEVDDGLLALQSLARSVRDAFLGPVVGITGSAGKTTTRALTALALEPLGVVHHTEGNLNNHVGLPLTILRAPVDAAVWVLEMGMSHLGEIHLLQDICQPTVRLVTNVGAAHVEGVGSIEGVAQAKGELFLGARPGDVCCVNLDDPRVAHMPLPPGVVTLGYGLGRDSRQIRCDVRLTDAAVDPRDLSTRFRVETPRGTVLGRVAVPGLHVAHDACSAIAVAHALGLGTEGLAQRLARYEPVGMRQRLETLPGGMRLINDAYNSNPLSARAALDTLAAVEADRRVALLGDMLELGAAEARAHREILELALSLDLVVVGLAGPRFSRAAQGIDDPRLVVADDAEALAAAACARLGPEDFVLVKGSRGLAMERVVQALKASATPSAVAREG